MFEDILFFLGKKKLHKQEFLHWKQVELSEPLKILRLSLAEENITVTFPITSVFFLCLVWLSGMSGWSIRARASGGKKIKIYYLCYKLHSSLLTFAILCTNQLKKT